MRATRQEVIDHICKYVDMIIPGDTSNSELLREQLSKMSKADFENYLRSLKPTNDPAEIAKRNVLPFYKPNLVGKRISIARNFEIAEKLGKKLRHRLVMTDPVSGNEYITPHEYPVLDLPARRQAQTIIKKRSIPEHNQRIDELTGQPTADSKGSRISSPELAALGSRGLDNTIREFIDFRGGNEAAYREMRRLLIENGEANVAQLEGLGRAKSTNTASVLLNCMHIGNNFNPDTRVPDDARKPTESR